MGFKKTKSRRVYASLTTPQDDDRQQEVRQMKILIMENPDTGHEVLITRHQRDRYLTLKQRGYNWKTLEPSFEAFKMWVLKNLLNK